MYDGGIVWKYWYKLLFFFQGNESCFESNHWYPQGLVLMKNVELRLLREQAEVQRQHVFVEKLTPGLGMLHECCLLFHCETSANVQ